MKRKYNINFYLEKRKIKGTDKLITENLPILMSVTFNRKRLWFYVGYKIDSNKWTDKKNGEKVQRVNKNTFNKDNDSATDINKRLNKLETIVHDIFTDAGNRYPTVKELRNKLRDELGEKSISNNTVDTFYNHFNAYIKDSSCSEGRKNQLTSTLNHFDRFAPGIKIRNITAETIQDFKKYLLNDKDAPKSLNTVIGIIKRLKPFFKGYAMKNQLIEQNPFNDFEFGENEREIYGEPIYLTKAERDLLFNAKIENDKLARVRDMFVLQCLIGCRVGDFVKLTKDNIIDGFVIYYPNKTKDEKGKMCKVPLSEKAISIINKYNLPDGSLVPYITGQRYNEYLKQLFKLETVKLNRPVQRLNPRTRKNETVRLSDIVSSHMARRTFIGLLHKTVKNEVIASMSGHSKDSQAFHRYYKIEDDDLKTAIKTIE